MSAVHRMGHKYGDKKKKKKKKTVYQPLKFLCKGKIEWQ